MTRFLTRPRRVGFAGLWGDTELDGGGGGGGFDVSSIPTTASGAVDWSAMTFPSAPDFSLPAASPQSQPFDFSKLASDVVKGAQTYYGAQTAVNNANYASQLQKARAKAAIDVARAGGSNAALTARAGLPSPTLLLAAGVALGAVLLLRR